MPQTKPILALVALALVLGACDTNDVFEDDTLVYRATLAPLNDSGVSGTATFTISDEGDLELTDDDELQVSVTASGLDDTVHPQHIHAEAECPAPSADDNGDGFVDIAEGNPAYGAILAPLDGQLLDAEAQAGTFPEGASISYSQEVDYDDFLDAYDLDDDALDLGGRTVVLHGTTRDLPDTVASMPGLPNETTLPVACGEIELVGTDG